jgi:replicative DNA helicase
MAQMTQAGSEKGRAVDPDVHRNGSSGVKSNPDGRRDLVVRSMPESLAAEAAVLGSMIIDPKCIADVIEILGREGFYRIEHQHIFDALIGLYEKAPWAPGGDKGEAIDGVLLRDELEKRKLLSEVGGAEYVGRVMDSVPSSANVQHYARIVKDKMLLRELITAVSGIMDEAYSQSGEVRETLDEAERLIFAVTEKNISGSATVLKDLITQVYELIERRDGKHVTGLGTGYYELDDLTSGLQNGEMVVVAGRPSMGKTSLVLNIAEHIAVQDNVPVAVFSLEMGRQALAERFLCSVSEIDAQAVRKGILKTEHYQKLVKACSILAEAPIFIDDTAALTPLELRAKARRLKTRHDIKCIMVDYLQLMHMGGRVESRQQEITTISRYLKGLARELNIPVVVLSQLNRAAEGREGHRPRMSDLRESGSIEQDADVVMLLHREDYYKHGDEGYEPDNIAELIIAKQRNGPTGNVKLIFRERITRFENMSRVEQEPSPF